MNAPRTKIGVTLYNFREHCKTAEDLDRTLGRLKGFGFEAVQVSGVGLDPDVIRKALDRNGLYCCATHEGLDAYRNRFDEVVKKLETLGCGFTALGHPGGDCWSAEGVVKLAAELDVIGKKFRERGIIFGYHNHSDEFERFTDRTFLDEIYSRTDRKNLSAELDTYWVQHGGGSPTAWIRKMKGRIHVLHVKDFRISGKKQQHCEIGGGNLDWPEVLKAGKASGTRWFVIEQDDPVAERDIFASVEISLKNLRSFGLK